MKKVAFNAEKDESVKVRHGISFETVKKAISEGNLLAILENPNQTRYPRQKLLIVKIKEYAYAVPFIEDEEKIFLKTVFPSRKYTKLYVKRKERKYEE